MKIVIYQDRNLHSKRIQETLYTIYLSLKKNYKNFEIIYVNYKDFKLIKCDYAIIWNVYCKFKNDTINRKLIKEFQEKNNDKLIVVELGFINRDKYSSFGFDHISNFGNYPELPNDSKRLDELKINVKELIYNNSLDKYILFCSQVPWDTQVQDIDYEKWIIDTIKEIQKHSNRTIVFRRHPKHNSPTHIREGKYKCRYYDELFFKSNNLNVIISNNTLENDFKNCYCVIAYNSTILVDAILYGRPVLSGSNTSIVSDLTIKDFSTIENLTKFSKDDVTKCLSKVAYKQWSLNDFEKCKPFKYFFYNNYIMSHLGGHVNTTNLETGTFNYLNKKYNLKSFLDIGCGPGGMVQLANENNLLARGLEGDDDAIKQSNVSNLITKIDFSKEKYDNQLGIDSFDLGYSSEFLEHVDEEYIDNYMTAFQKCKYVLITAAPPKWPGHHHVNCKDHEYWVRKFNEYGFYHYPYETIKCRINSTMNTHRGKNKQFIKHRVLFFINIKFISKDKFKITNELPEKIKKNILVESNKYSELDVPGSHTNQVSNTNGHLFKSTIPLVSYLL